MRVPTRISLESPSPFAPLAVTVAKGLTDVAVLMTLAVVLAVLLGASLTLVVAVSEAVSVAVAL